MLKSWTSAQCCFRVDAPSTPPAQHWAGVWSLPCVCWVRAGVSCSSITANHKKDRFNGRRLFQFIQLQFPSSPHPPPRVSHSSRPPLSPLPGYHTVPVLPSAPSPGITQFPSCPQPPPRVSHSSRPALSPFPRVSHSSRPALSPFPRVSHSSRPPLSPFLGYHTVPVLPSAPSPGITQFPSRPQPPPRVSHSSHPPLSPLPEYHTVPVRPSASS